MRSMWVGYEWRLEGLGLQIRANPLTPFHTSCGMRRSPVSPTGLSRAGTAHLRIPI
jgi:hypothetical protein